MNNSRAAGNTFARYKLAPTVNLFDRKLKDVRGIRGPVVPRREEPLRLQNGTVLAVAGRGNAASQQNGPSGTKPIAIG